ncbi:hypothetical protein F506_20095 [Herbaspirillum hiltneri N3]|uniref:AAA domain-containing protein n=1 Tax=Herbaspirillum hiltneri N3 TaxID=1262470 RepID=A0ABN4I165_9BURK|nr:hypothetical protein [Herbaspirillum hiltneri]AKZ64647.1 hypothetical protein F506_20095 [Herbaspirillum hiltneri N3]
MQNQIVVGDDPLPILATKAIEPLPWSLAVSDLSGNEMTELMRPKSMDEITVRMRKSGNPRAKELQNADINTKLDAITNDFPGAHMVVKETSTFFAQVNARVRRFYQSKLFGDEAFRLYFHACTEIKNGGNLRPIPPCLSSFTDTSFWMTGPSGMGRTAALERFVQMLGKPFRVEGTHPVPQLMYIFPCIFLRYPTCGTLEGLFRDLRYQVLAGISNHTVEINALSQLLGGRGKNRGTPENVAIALCTMLNVGIFILDGGGWANVNSKTSSIFSFLLKLREFSGIPILVSGTSAFLYSATYMNKLNGNLFNGPGLHMDRFALPKHIASEDGKEQPKGLWQKIVAWLWKQGFIPEDCAMPAALPMWIYEATLGNYRWLKQGFEALHLSLISRSELLHPGKLTREEVLNIFGTRLMLHQSTMRAITSMTFKPKKDDQIRILQNLDYMPTPMFNDPTVNGWLSPIFDTRNVDR